MNHENRLKRISEAKALLDSVKTIAANLDATVVTPWGLRHEGGDLRPSLLKVRAALRLLEEVGDLPPESGRPWGLWTVVVHFVPDAEVSEMRARIDREAFDLCKEGLLSNAEIRQLFPSARTPELRAMFSIQFEGDPATVQARLSKLPGAKTVHAAMGRSPTDDDATHLDAQVQHISHMFDGYREYTKRGGAVDCPFAPDSAREFSWRAGVQLAEEDLKVKS